MPYTFLTSLIEFAIFRASFIPVEQRSLLPVCMTNGAPCRVTVNISLISSVEFLVLPFVNK